MYGAVTIGLTVASAVEIDERVHHKECMIVGTTKFWLGTWSIFFIMDLEVILASISLCVFFCFVHRKIHNRQIAVLLQNSVIHVTVNACIMGLDSLRMGYHIYMVF